MFVKYSMVWGDKPAVTKHKRVSTSATCIVNDFQINSSKTE